MTTLVPVPAIPAAPSIVPVTMVPIAPTNAGSRREPSTMLPSEAREVIEQDDAGKWDFSAARRDLVMRNGELEFPLDVGGEEPIRERLAPTQYAFGQICTRLGLPASYLRRCPLVLRDQNMNHWFRQGSLAHQPRHVVDKLPTGAEESWDEVSHSVPVFGQPSPQVRECLDEEKWLLRARHGTLRAALSESYSPLDNAVLMDTLLPALPAQYRVQWLGLQDESLHLRLIDANASQTVLPGDDYFVGVHVANSEVGMRSITIDALVYRLVCTNGLIAMVKGKSLLRRRHIHIAAPRFKAALEEALSQALAATDDLLANLQRSAQTEVRDPEQAIDLFARLWQQSEHTAEIAKAALQSEPGASQHTVYGLINAFTHAAQLLPDEKRYDLEVQAGQLAQQVDFPLALSKAERAMMRTPATKPDIAEYARRVFDAEVVGRQAHAGGGS